MNIYEYIGGIVSDLGYNYTHGSYKAINKYLSLSVKNGNVITSRFPMVALITQDMIEDVDVNPSLDREYPLHIVIFNISKPNYTPQQRLDNNFKTVLYPIYDGIIEALREDSRSEFHELPHKKKDIFYYSTDDNKSNNVLDKILDAIEITDLSILKNFNIENCN